MTAKKKKKTPQFKNEITERKFWAGRDSTEYIDWSKAEKAVFPKLKPSTKTISIRLPEHLLNELKSLVECTPVTGAFFQ
ncbi:MAG: hypothetical protein IEMM0002_0763 [bacterium]|nr:MAG: hypothetical protein IEMM0002_0763 [bacterium]